jgi:nicotinamide-nucleotide amidase
VSPRPPDDAALTALAGQVGAALRRAGYRLATAESCTGGWIAKSLTDLPGSSAWFEAGVVAYANAAKSGLLGVPADVLAAEGAVSRGVAEAMATGARRACSADMTVAVTGIAGPGGGTPDKPVGTVWFAWSGPGGLRAQCLQFDGDRDAVRRQAVAVALEGVLTQLSDA